MAEYIPRIFLIFGQDRLGTGRTIFLKRFSHQMLIGSPDSNLLGDTAKMQLIIYSSHHIHCHLGTGMYHTIHLLILGNCNHFLLVHQTTRHNGLVSQCHARGIRIIISSNHIVAHLAGFLDDGNLKQTCRQYQ